MLAQRIIHEAPVAAMPLTIIKRISRPIPLVRTNAILAIAIEVVRQHGVNFAEVWPNAGRTKETTLTLLRHKSLTECRVATIKKLRRLKNLEGRCPPSLLELSRVLNSGRGHSSFIEWEKRNGE